MILTTPLHDRVAAANQTGLWSHWAGYLVAEKYQMSEKAEYFAIRNGVGVFDTSPLYKYLIGGPDAEDFLRGVLVRDVAGCPPGHAQYTVWCDGDGFVLEDGVVMRLAGDEFLLTAARPNLAYFEDLVGRLEVKVVDVSDDYGALAVQGPRSRRVLEQLAPEVNELGFFGVTAGEVAGREAVVSRTGFTGDLGYEIWVSPADACEVWDAVMEAGHGHGVAPVGQQALLMARLEAGLLLIDVDFHSSRYAWTDNQRSTPGELGLGWMVGDPTRPFVGRDALARGRPRWKLTGLLLDWEDWDRRHAEAGLIPPKDHRPIHQDLMVYGSEGEKLGWASSFMYSPMLQRHIALARVRPDQARPGTKVGLEVTVDHDHHVVTAEVTALPFYNPAHKTA